MRRFWPGSLLGQVLLAVALALLVAQSISAVMLYRAAETRRDSAALNAAAFRLVTAAQRDAREQRIADRFADRERGARSQERRGRPRRLLGPDGDGPRALRIEQSATSPLRTGERRLTAIEEELATILQREGVAVKDIIVLRRNALDDPFIRARPRLLSRIARADNRQARMIVAAMRTDGSEVWQVARAFKPAPQRGALWTIVLQTLLIYLLLVGLHFLLLRRITRPLAALTDRTEKFGQSANALPPIAPEGPDDVRKLIDAHNTMEGRIASLLDEKDVMLGAIGHDLKTPLAALRVRIESVEDEQERTKMAASIEDISRSLDDILSLARVGRGSEPPEKAELSALVASVVEEFEDMAKPVTFQEAARLVTPVHVTWLKRGLRNLIDNALRYAGTAEIALAQDGQTAILRVDDNGPGIAEAALARITEPFRRGEISRNRQTGGAGLGLTLARAIAEQHGGVLVLSNRDGGGLRAEIRIPLGDT